MSFALPSRQDVTGLILAGGLGRRMQGQDKGLLSIRGKTLTQWTQARLAPQVGSLGISANRNLDDYQKLGVEVWPDSAQNFEGPLAGMASGLMHCVTPYMAVVPCDTPCFPVDLVERLSAGLTQADAQLALATTTAPDRDQPRIQPVFCLLHVSLLPSLQQFLATGERKVEQWARQHRLALVHFDDAEAFAGANTPQELAALSQRLASADGRTSEIDLNAN